VKILFMTGSRGEWGYIRPVLRLCRERPELRYSLCATNMQLLASHGLPVAEIRADGFEVEDELYMALEGTTHFAMAKSLGIFMTSFTDVLARVRPDWVLLAGDRGEQLMASIVAAYTYIPTAHIQAGELSGNIDGTTRHAIGKFAHLHFASNIDAANRLRLLGEEEFRIHQVGAPQLDELVRGEYTPLEDLERKHALDLSEPYLLIVQHPVTEEYDDIERQVAELNLALARFTIPQIWILPNNDAGAQFVRQGIQQFKHGRSHVFANLKREDYLGLLKHCRCIVGNSSSGLLEAPTFEVPAVNLGRRQHGRIQGRNVINAPFEQSAIVAAIQKACSDIFRRSLVGTLNPYGDGHSSEKILDVLLQTPRESRLLTKQLTYPQELSDVQPQLFHHFRNRHAA
jgi:GDP/UDP-N,N'-diacetylbacillosamine 2-epimerase (hydrolysing)